MSRASTGGVAPARACRASERGDWLRLIRSENVGAATFWSLLSRYGSAAAALEAVPGLADRGGAKRAIALVSAREAQRELAAAKTLGVAHLFYGMADYPPALAALSAPPPVITVRGDPAILSRRAVAVVGSRKASTAGRTMARTLSEAFAQAGLVVVSGLALGIDGEAHRAALPATVGVVAGGVDTPTPQEHLQLAGEIVRGGALVSEMPLGWSPFARDFPRRNRIIAGLVEAVVVVEAAKASGTLYTARYAIDAGRDVFAVPGSPLDPRAAGCLSLLREGAGLVVDARDVLSTLRREGAGPRLPGFAEDGDGAFFGDAPDGLGERVYDLLSLAPVDVDEVVRATRSDTGAVLAAVMELELAGRAEREPDGRVRVALAS